MMIFPFFGAQAAVLSVVRSAEPSDSSFGQPDLWTGRSRAPETPGGKFSFPLGRWVSDECERLLSFGMLCIAVRTFFGTIVVFESDSDRTEAIMTKWNKTAKS